MDAGFTDVITKPLPRNVCREILAQHGRGLDTLVHFSPQPKPVT
jgi:hypothetical protein